MKTRHFLDMGAHCFAYHAQLALSGADLSYSCGEDAYFISPSTNFMGVADGVSAWSAYALGNSAYISYYMMSNAKTLSEQGFNNTLQIVKDAFNSVWAMWEQKKMQIPNGSSTVCVAKLSDDDNEEAGPTIQYSNLGDSMIMVIRPERFDDMNVNLRVIHQSAKQYAPEKVNGTPVPLQLCFYPYQGRKGTGAPEQVDKSDTVTLKVRKEDVVIIATDGLWDNVTIDEVLKHTANAFITSASKNINSNDLAKRLAECAQKNNYKPDDITVLVGVVREQFRQCV